MKGTKKTAAVNPANAKNTTTVPTASATTSPQQSAGNGTINEALRQSLRAWSEKLIHDAPLVWKNVEDQKKMENYLDNIKPHLENDVSPLIFPDPFTRESLPNVDILVNLGLPNLVWLRKSKRQSIKSLNHRIAKLQASLENTNISSDQEIRACTYGTKAGCCLGEASVLCPVYTKNHGVFFKKSLANLVRSESERKELMALSVNEPCLAFSADETTRSKLVQRVKELIKDLRAEKRLNQKYLDNLTKAIHDKRTLPDLPLFVDFRPENYLSQNEIVCIFTDDKKFTCAFKDKLGAKWIKDETMEELQMYFCKITGDSYTKRKIPELEHSGLKSGRIHLVENRSTDEVIGVDEASMEAIMQEIDYISPHTPFIMKPDELLQLVKNPGYARIWAYSSFNASQEDQTTEIEALLKKLEKQSEVAK